MHFTFGLVLILIIFLIIILFADWQIPVGAIILIMAAEASHDVPRQVYGGKRVERIGSKDDFPYKKLFIKTSIEEFFNNIKNYAKYLVIEGNNIRKLPASYAEADIVTDLFNEKPRMLANVKDSISPYDYWQTNKKYIKERCSGDLECMREDIYANSREATTFSPVVSAYIYDTLLEEPGDVYDPFGGWGDRMIGAICSDKVLTYKCTDLNPDLADGYSAIIEHGPKASFTIGDALELAKTEPANTYNLIFTSPPYFNFERYNKKNKLPDNYPRWLNEFVEPLIVELYRVLKPNGILAIHISNISTARTLGDDFKKICSKHGSYVKSLYTVSKISVPVIIFKKK